MFCVVVFKLEWNKIILTAENKQKERERQHCGIPETERGIPLKYMYFPHLRLDLKILLYVQFCTHILR